MTIYDHEKCQILIRNLICLKRQINFIIEQMSKENKFEITDEEVWYLIINNETKGPLSLRDLDVMLRTNDINSRTFAWKAGMKEWKILNQIEEIKESILQSSKEILQIERKRQLLEKSTIQKKQGQAKPEDAADQIIQNKDQNPLTILETAVDNLLKKTFLKTEDGKWKIYDQDKGQWVLENEEPVQRIQKMKTLLFNKLKNELFFEDKINKRKKQISQPEQNKEPEIPLTQQQLLKKQKNKKKTKKQAEKKKEKWYNAKINTFIYISGLPLDITQQQLKQFVTKAGILRIDLNTGKQKLKLYKDQNGAPKGDAAISFAKPESVQIALQNLNDKEIRSGFKVKIQRAQFNQKQEDYKIRESKKENLAKKIQSKKMQKKQLSWDQNVEEQGEGLKIVIMKHMLDATQIDNQQYLQNAKKDITSQVQKIGQIQRIRFYETHPDGVVEVKFKKEKDAESCVYSMNGRFFDGRQIQCDYWDGQTDYKRDASSLLLQEERLKKFGEEIETKNTNNLEKIEEDKKQEDKGQDQDEEAINNHLLQEN